MTHIYDSQIQWLEHIKIFEMCYNFESSKTSSFFCCLTRCSFLFENIRQSLGCPAARVTAAFPMVWLLGLNGYGGWSQVSRKSEAQISASRISESKAKNPCVITQQKGPEIWGCLRAAMKIHRVSHPSPGPPDSWKLDRGLPEFCKT